MFDSLRQAAEMSEAGTTAMAKLEWATIAWQCRRAELPNGTRHETRNVIFAVQDDHQLLSTWVTCP